MHTTGRAEDGIGLRPGAAALAAPLSSRGGRLLRPQRVECYAGTGSVARADEVSGWLLQERAPLSTPDGRWDRLLYPIHRVEELLRARAGTWA